jgi:peroxiredoxin
MKRFLLFLFLVAIMAVTGCSEKSSPGGGAREGASAPDFTLTDAAGQKVTLSSLRGNVVFLNFWATWCPPCREEIPSMMRLNKAMEGTQFRMLAVSIDDGGIPAVEAFFKKTGFTLPALSDPGQSIGKMYGITGVPETFVLDKKGVIVKKVVGGMDWSAPESVKFFKELAAQ